MNGTTEDTIATRLQVALNARRKRSIRSLQQALPSGVKGRSYSNVYGYVKGTVEPPVETLLAMADVLEVAPLWLMTGRGTMDDEVVRAGDQPRAPWRSRPTATRAMSRNDEARLAQTVEPALQAATGRTLPDAHLALVVDYVHRARWNWELVAGQSNPNDREIATTIGEAIVAPLRSLGVHPRNLTDEQWTGYALPVIQALIPVAGVGTGSRKPPRPAQPKRPSKKRR